MDAPLLGGNLFWAEPKIICRAWQRRLDNQSRKKYVPLAEHHVVPNAVGGSRAQLSAVSESVLFSPFCSTSHCWVTSDLQDQHGPTVPCNGHPHQGPKEQMPRTQRTLWRRRMSPLWMVLWMKDGRERDWLQHTGTGSSLELNWYHTHNIYIYIMQ